MLRQKQKQTRFIKRVLYTLKKGYGFPITFYKIVSEGYDLETGKRTPDIEYKKIKRAIILPATAMSKFEYDLAYIAAAKNFTYGGLYGTATRKIIIDARDLDGFEIKTKDYFIWDEKRWEVAQVTDLEYQTAFLIVGKMVEGSPRYMIEDFNVESTFQFTQEVS